MKQRTLNIVLIAITAIFLIMCFTSCGPSHEEMLRRAKDKQDSIATAPYINAAGRENDILWPNLTYSAMDYGLSSGVIVKWSHRHANVPKDLTEANFPQDVIVYVKGYDGTTKAFPCTFKIWDQLQTNDTLK